MNEAIRRGSADPKCLADKPECFAYVSGHCKCLSDTRFKNNECPFYKTQDQVRRERYEI